MPPFVTITKEAVARSKRDADKHVKKAAANDWNKVGFNYVFRAEGTFGSYCAEEGIAQLLGLKDWRRDLDRGFGAPDVGVWSVRYAMNRDGGLKSYVRDGRHPYVLVTAGFKEREFEVRGWLRRSESLELRRRGIGFPMGGNLDGWSIPRQWLHPWGEDGWQEVNK